MFNEEGAIDGKLRMMATVDLWHHGSSDQI
jgi:hypothetical protein